MVLIYYELSLSPLPTLKIMLGNRGKDDRHQRKPAFSRSPQSKGSSIISETNNIPKITTCIGIQPTSECEKKWAKNIYNDLPCVATFVH